MENDPTVYLSIWAPLNPAIHTCFDKHSQHQSMPNGTKAISRSTKDESESASAERLVCRLLRCRCGFSYWTCTESLHDEFANGVHSATSTLASSLQMTQRESFVQYTKLYYKGYL